MRSFNLHINPVRQISKTRKEEEGIKPAITEDSFVPGLEPGPFLE